MRRLVLVLTITALGATLSTAGVGAAHRTTSRETAMGFTIPIPAVGNATFGAVKLKVTAKSKKTKVVTPTLVVSNTAQLGQGYFSIQVVADPRKALGKETVTLFYLEYMGNIGTSSASSATVKATAPSGEKIAPSVDDLSPDQSCEYLSGLNTWFEGRTNYTLPGPHYPAGLSSDAVYLMNFVPKAADQSEPESFIDNTLPLVWGDCPGSPETPDQGD